jgi:hypothetical protein
LVVVMEYGDRSWYVCTRTEYILVEQDPVWYESNQPIVESGFKIRIRYACVYLGGGLQRRYLALTRSSRFECELSNMSCWVESGLFLK